MKARELLLIIEDIEKWRISIDHSSKVFTIFKGSEEICTGEYDSSALAVDNIRYLKSSYSKNFKVQSEVKSIINRNFIGYTLR